MRPLLACNRLHFQHLMQHLFNLAENLETENFNNYYAFLSTKVKFSSKSNLTKSIQLVANRVNFLLTLTMVVFFLKLMWIIFFDILIKIMIFFNN